MAKYGLKVINKAYRELSRVHPDMGKKILKAIESLASEPRPRQSHKLAQSENSYRLRVGDYRILYQIDDEIQLIIVFKVGHRRDVYR